MICRCSDCRLRVQIVTLPLIRVKILEAIRTYPPTLLSSADSLTNISHTINISVASR